MYERALSEVEIRQLYLASDAGLVVYYPFNGNANDASGNGNDGIVYGASLTADRFGNPNRAYSFDGIDDYVQPPNESNFDLAALTIAGTIKVPNYDNENWIISKGLNFGNFTLMINEDGGAWPGHASYVHQVSGGNWSSVASDSPVPLNEFFHIAVTMDPNGTFEAYINGQRQSIGGSTPVAPILNDANVTIGAGGISAITDYFDGVIDDIRMYERALSEAEIRQLYLASDAGLVAYYPFNGNANDASGYGNDGIVNGATLTADRCGNPDSAYSFDGTDDYVELPNESNFDLTALTIAATIKVPDYSRDNWIISKGFYFGNFTLMIAGPTYGSDAGRAVYVHQGSTANWSIYASDSPVPLDEFFHIAVTMDPNGTFEAYINGQRQSIGGSTPVAPISNDANVPNVPLLL